jgi:hypothetical protein
MNKAGSIRATPHTYRPAKLDVKMYSKRTLASVEFPLSRRLIPYLLHDLTIAKIDGKVSYVILTSPPSCPCYDVTRL